MYVELVCKELCVYRIYTRRSRYISDEPDGAGDHAGAPVGVSPAQVQAAYDAAKQADPYHPVSLSLNCMESARYYAAAADIVMVDVYPIGISADGCGKTFGCCGCDDCDGHVDDVAHRVRHVGRELLGGARPIGIYLADDEPRYLATHLPGIR